MAITKLLSPSAPNPTVSGAGGSWDLAMAQLTACKKMLSGEQMILTQWTNASALPALKLGSYLQHAGSIYVVDTADYPITAPTSDGTYYIRLAVSAETLAVSFISSLSGYSWNTQHNGLYDSSNNQVLPYQIVRSGGNYAKRRILNPYHTSGFSTIDYLGNIICSNAIIAGHDIDSELDTLNGRVNQGVKTTDSPTFASVNTGQGANELYAMNQNLRTTDSPTFASINTGQGANEVYKISNEEIGRFSSTDVNLSAMDIGEIRFFHANPTYEGDILKTPITGKFIVVATGGDVITSSIGYPTGADVGIAKGSGSAATSVNGIIRRIS